MKLWLLRPVTGLPDGDNPWKPWYDKHFGFVIRADTERAARQMAHDEDGDENDTDFLGRATSATKTPWLESTYSTCVELSAEGEPDIVIVDFRAA